MSDNKAIFEIKIAKIAQNVPKIDILQMLQKIPVFLPVTVTEIWPG